MRLLLSLTYYRPHVSGLTIYVERLARALARRGHAVTVLTSRYDRALPARERLAGVEVVRAPVLMRVSKGVIMPTLGALATRLAWTHDAISLHLPQLDASGIALRGRLFGKPTVLTYHCDLQLPPTPFSRAINGVVHLSNRVAAALAHAIVAYTRDYAEHSPLLSRYLGKVRVIPPPVEVAQVDAGAVAEFRKRFQLNGHRVIGMATRLAAEKGVEHLLAALPAILERNPEARVLFAGQHQNVLGEEEYARRLGPTCWWCPAPTAPRVLVWCRSSL
jgi:glycosyltransferase involved in cell wall biosynthesis